MRGLEAFWADEFREETIAESLLLLKQVRQSLLEF